MNELDDFRMLKLRIEALATDVVRIAHVLAFFSQMGIIPDSQKALNAGIMAAMKTQGDDIFPPV